MGLSKLQSEIVNAPEEKIVMVSAAASGKTRTLTERVRKLLRDGVQPRDIAVITFTNLAAQELKERLADDYKEGMYIGTIHGLANKFLCSHGIDTSKAIKEEKFDEFFNLLEENPECVSHYKYLFLDETQDSSPSEFNFIFNMIDPDSFFCVGDPAQSIYGFRNAKPLLFKQLSKRPDVKLYNLNENYRNGVQILNYAKRILTRGGMTDASVPMRDINGTVYEGTYNKENLARWIKSTDNFGDWAILCRTNSEISKIMDDLDEFDIPSLTFKQGEMTKKELETAMKENKVKVLTIHSSKGLEFPHVAVYGAVWWNEESYRVNYVAATRARDTLLWLSPAKAKAKPKRKYW